MPANGARLVRASSKDGVPRAQHGCGSSAYWLTFAGTVRGLPPQRQLQDTEVMNKKGALVVLVALCAVR